MKDPMEIIKSVVRKHRVPKINDLLSVDYSDFVGTKFLLSKLLSSSVEVTHSKTQASFYLPKITQPVLEVHGTEVGGFVATGPYYSKLEAILLAARIHEVESYEWVYLPFEQRAALLEAEAVKLQIDSNEFKMLMSKWNN